VQHVRHPQHLEWADLRITSQAQHPIRRNV
jgi:hypothetical protein